MPNKKSSRRRTVTFDDVRDLALSMPEVTETTSWGMPTFKAGKTTFAVEPHPRPDVEASSLGVPMSFEERGQLLASRPDVYYLTDHWTKYPGVLVRLSSIGRDELREILSAAWQYAMERQGPTRRPRRNTAGRERTRPRPRRSPK
jgi:hypothetical protein